MKVLGLSETKIKFILAKSILCLDYEIAFAKKTSKEEMYVKENF